MTTTSTHVEDILEEFDLGLITETERDEAINAAAARGRARRTITEVAARVDEDAV